MSMLHALLAAALTVSVAISAAATATSAAAQSPAVADAGQTARRLLQLANETRAGHERPPLRSEASLAAAARYFARYMAGVDRISHEADGSTPAARAQRHGYDYCVVLENIAFQFDSRGFTPERLASELVEGWMNSPGHRTNLLDPDVTETGIAVARSAKTGRYYAVHLFGRPKSESLKFQIANGSGETVRYRIGDRRFALEPRQIRTHGECRPGSVTIDAAGATLEPKPGDRFNIRRSPAGALRVERQ